MGGSRRRWWQVTYWSTTVLTESHCCFRLTAVLHKDNMAACCCSAQLDQTYAHAHAHTHTESTGAVRQFTCTFHLLTSFCL